MMIRTMPEMELPFVNFAFDFLRAKSNSNPAKSSRKDDVLSSTIPRRFGAGFIVQLFWRVSLQHEYAAFFQTCDRALKNAAPQGRRQMIKDRNYA